MASNKPPSIIYELKWYFTDDEWKNISDYEMNRLEKILENYNFLIGLGLDPDEPDFIRRKRERDKDLMGKMKASSKKDKEFEDEFIFKKPENVKKAKASSRSLKEEKIDFANKWNNLFTDAEREESVIKLTEFNEIFDTFIQLLLRHKDKKIRNLVALKLKTFEKRSKSTDKTKESDTAGDNDNSKFRRYPKRNLPPINYKEPEDFHFDDFIFCDICGREWFGPCAEHPLKHIKDTEVTRQDDSFALSTLPKNVAVTLSKIPNSGHGVWSKEVIPAGIMFGPYQGRKLLGVKDVTYTWQIKCDDNKTYCIDGTKTSESNWMRFVNCARYSNEQNLIAFQYQQNIYYRTVKDVPPFSELLVFYGFEYAKILGITRETFYNPDMKLIRDLSFPCEQCPMQFSCPLYLLKHRKYCRKKVAPRKLIQQVNNEKMKEFECNNNLLNGINEDSNKCNVCDYSCTQAGNLQSHMRTHTGEKPYKCNVCDYSCTQAGNLQSHMRTHTGEKPYKCNVCDYSCIQAGNLQSHMRTHTGEKPYKCNVCDYSCIQAGTLQRHMRTHTGEKPYKCNVCDYSCTHAGTLQRHMRTHTGEKPYKCNVCDYSCIQAGNLQSHMRTHTGEKPYKCNVCDYSCTHAGALPRHMRTHTGEKLIS